MALAIHDDSGPLAEENHSTLFEGGVNVYYRSFIIHQPQLPYGPHFPLNSGPI